ncbi:bifunctional ornithine acetyltransferase/N-acetylglutamate synthase [Metabacillus sp. GX 13764]|uniref:bifunctional ornithine acetyltransferase/N-acetylglutamate synthase n=1 Tax=Metabacillus kandeliae TaxID=2900151 RepID=UPI001E614579|nr:bifunctional ornithine acetyltransferase/N-acetylglutamate synthase [Metabacillus kandeliae]
MQEAIAAEITKVSEGNAASPKGFSADGVHCGLRYEKKDIGILFSKVPANCAAVYTQSHFQAAPLQVTRESIAEEGKIQALLVNSGIANACTGKKGLLDAYEMRSLAAAKLGIKEHHVAVASTGVIGEHLKMDLIEKGVEMLNPVPEGGSSFHTAILTTDTCEKSSCWQFKADGKTITVGGAAKGSGMIHPNMATMLGFISTDANVEADALQEALKNITNHTFNQITVDGETSTNDMVLVMANGCAENEPLNRNHKDWDIFCDTLQIVCEELAKSIARDGEGATKLIEANVSGARTDEEARVVAKKIVGSSLVKSAVYGEDANWGRIIGAMGHSNAYMEPAGIDIYLGGHCMLEAGEPQSFSEELAKAYLQGEEITIGVDLHVGEGKGTAWGCDLTYDYVKINASYRT